MGSLGVLANEENGERQRFALAEIGVRSLED
jgi:hypothetical protein